MKTILSQKKIGAKQKKFFLMLVAGSVGLVALLVSFTSEDRAPSTKPASKNDQEFDVISQEVDPEKVRLAVLEDLNDSLNTRLGSMEQTISDLNEQQALNEEEKQNLADITRELSEKVKAIDQELHEPDGKPKKTNPILKSWQGAEKKDGSHVSFEIPAGTVVKALLVSGADCSVAVQKPTGPNMVLLRPLENGNLPRNVRVALKGSVIIGNAIGDISSERVYIRAERMSIVERGGSFNEMELSAYVSGEDGREGMRGVVVDRSGQIIARAAFAAFLQGAGQATETVLNLKALDKEEKAKYIMGNAGFQGGSTALNKMTDYYIKRAEQLQPAIQIAAGRVVDIVFTRTVKFGEKDLKKRFDMERAAKRNR